MKPNVYLSAGLLAGGLYTGGGAAPSLLHGSVQLDAGGGSAALEQGGGSQPKRRSPHEVLLSHRLGYGGWINTEPNRPSHARFIAQDVVIQGYDLIKSLTQKQQSRID